MQRLTLGLLLPLTGCDNVQDTDTLRAFGRHLADPGFIRIGVWSLLQVSIQRGLTIQGTFSGRYSGQTLVGDLTWLDWRDVPIRLSRVQ